MVPSQVNLLGWFAERATIAHGDMFLSKSRRYLDAPAL
jgi:hypothetical protein